MASVNWTTDSEGGYTYAPELSKVLRLAVRALTKFRMLCDAKDASGMGVSQGFHMVLERLPAHDATEHIPAQ